MTSNLRPLDPALPDLPQVEEQRTAPSHRSRVWLAGGRSFVVRVTVRDRIQWDKTAPRKQWGKAQDVPFLAQAFVTFAAAKRQGDFTGSFEEFQDACEEIEDVPVEDSDTVRPTNPAAGDTSL